MLADDLVEDIPDFRLLFFNELLGLLDGRGETLGVEAGVDERLEELERHLLRQHALLVTDDDARCAQLDETLQTVVAVDDAAIEIVEVGRRETAAVQRDERAQVRRDHRNDLHDHPFRTIAALHEVLYDLQALHQLLLLQVRRGLGQVGAQIAGDLLEIHRGEHLVDGLGADHRRELVFTIFIDGDHVLFFGKKLVFLERGQARLRHDVVLEIENALDILQRHVQQRGDARGKRLQEPDMSDGRGELDMAHALAANARQRDFDAALFADDALVLHALVLAAQALVVLDGAKDARAEKAVAFRLERTVVDRFRLLDLAVRPGKDLFRRRDRDPDGIERLRRHLRVEKVHDLLVHAYLLSGPVALCLAADCGDTRVPQAA